MRLAIAIAMVLHGAAHLVGFAESWQWSMTESVPFKTTVLSGRLDLGIGGIRVAGLLWLLAAVAFGLVAAGAVMNSQWWVSVALPTAVASLVLSLVWWPESRVGVVVNAVLIAALVVGRELGFI
jgi:hypothetical protein